MEQGEGPLNLLPEELLLLILEYLEGESVLIASQPEFTLSKEDLHETFKKCSHDDKRAKPWSLSTSTDYDLVLQTLMEGLHTDLQNGLSLHDDLHHRAKVFGANVLHADSFGCFRQAYPVTVIRGGIRFSIPSTSVLVGDLLLLVEGETPPADGILVYGEVSEDDVRFTGEEFVYRLVNRSKLDTTIRAQSQITSGRCTVLVLAVGRNTQAYEFNDLLESEENSYIVPSRSFALGYSEGYQDFLSWKTAKPNYNKKVYIDAEAMIASYKVESIEISGHTFDSLEDYLYGRYLVLPTSVHLLLESVLTWNTSAFYQPLKKDKIVGGMNNIEKALLSLVPKERADSLWADSWKSSTRRQDEFDHAMVSAGLMCVTGHGSQDGKFSISLGANDSATNEKAALLEAKGLLAVALVIDKTGGSDQRGILLGLVGLRPILKKNCVATIQRLTAFNLRLDYHLLAIPFSRMFLERFADQILFEGKPHPLTVVATSEQFPPKKWVLAIGCFAHILRNKQTHLHHSILFFHDKNALLFNYPRIILLEDDWALLEDLLLGPAWKGKGMCSLS